MKVNVRFFILSLLFFCGAAGILFFFSRVNFAESPVSVDQNSFAGREQAYRANNIGVALLEQFNYKEAADAFRRALNLDPQLKIARINLAIALLNAQETDAALNEARTAAEIAPDRPQPAYLLGLIARIQNRTDDAVSFFNRVVAFDPNDVGSNVNLGQIYMQQRKYAEAVTVLRRALDAEPYNATAMYNLGTALLRNGAREEGQQLIAKFQALRQSGGATNIGQNYLEQGRYAEAIVSTGAEAELVDKTTPKVTFQNAQIGLLAQKKQTGIYSRYVFPEPVKPQSKYDILRALAGGATLFDFDNDGDLDLVKLNNSIGAVRKTIRSESNALVVNNFSLYRNDNGKFIVVTQTGDLGKNGKNVITAIVAGDFDNDGLTDLLAVGYENLQLFRNLGKGKFEDVSEKSKLAKPGNQHLSLSAAFVDADHDGDLDIFVPGYTQLDQRAEVNDYGYPRDFQGAPNLLLRNNGNGTFTDISEASKINQSKELERGYGSKSIAVVPTDYDNRRDVDFLVLNRGGRPNLFRNLRDGSFRDVAPEVGLDQRGNWTCAAVGDFNKDGFPDFFFGAGSDFFSNSNKGILAVSDGRGKFVLKDAPKGTENAASAQFLDYDNDGLLDLIVNTDKGFVLSRNLGNGWTDADSSAFKIKTSAAETLSDSRQILSADIDGDGDVDLFSFARNGSLHFLRNTGGEKNNAEIVRLTGRVSNKTGVGAKIEMRAGSLAQKLETYAASPAPAPADIHFGLGRREKPDAVRVIWTSGVIQAEVDFPGTAKNQTASRILKIEELDRKPSSCPYLYAWNGEKFEFITDFLGGGEMAYSHGDGQVNTPDPDEYVRLTSDQLRARNGKYEIRVTNELEEVLYLDRFQLVAIDHPEDREVYPNEGLGIPTAGKFILYATRNEKAPLGARDGYGKDVLERIRSVNRNFYDTFENEKFRGYAKPHELILTLDDRRGYNGKTLLLLTGWTDYAFSSDNVAAVQAGLQLQPPKLQVRNRRGEWETVIESTGISVGRPQTVVVDLTGKFLSESREVRILTNMKTFWDKIAVDTSSDEAAPLRISKIEPKSALLSERGFSLEIKPDGKEPVLADYDTVLNDGRWKYFSGNFTRLGNVLPLLSEGDDVFVISRTGDEAAISFDEKDLPRLESGMKRTFLLYSVGYSKEMDINSASPEAMLPLPFRAMTKYPYGAGEHFPMTEEKRRLYEEYTTRTVKSAFPRLETVLLK